MKDHLLHVLMKVHLLMYFVIFSLVNSTLAKFFIFPFCLEMGRGSHDHLVVKMFPQDTFTFNPVLNLSCGFKHLGLILFLDFQLGLLIMQV